jgi:hypothetical protein
MRAHAQMAEKLGAAFLPLPPGCQDPDGFLAPEYAADITHANAKFGELLLEHIASYYSTHLAERHS